MNLLLSMCICVGAVWVISVLCIHFSVAAAAAAAVVVISFAHSDYRILILIFRFFFHLLLLLLSNSFVRVCVSQWCIDHTENRFNQSIYNDYKCERQTTTNCRKKKSTTTTNTAHFGKVRRKQKATPKQQTNKLVIILSRIFEASEKEIESTAQNKMNNHNN